MAQPDFGGALLLMAIAGGMVWLAGGSARHLIGMGLIVMPLVAFAALAEPYRMRRLFPSWTRGRTRSTRVSS